jgi:hypothetical protein
MEVGTWMKIRRPTSIVCFQGYSIGRRANAKRLRFIGAICANSGTRDILVTLIFRSTKRTYARFGIAKRQRC